MHCPGTSNHADHLSQHPDYDEGAHDNENVLALPDKLFINAAAFFELNDEIDTSQQRNATEMEQICATNLIDQKDGQYLHTNRLIVPNDASLQ